jgi:nucleotide-binding universal stress UspA family protein
MKGIKRILVVCRSTKHCDKAIHYGIDLAKQWGGKLYAIHVLDDPFGGVVSASSFLERDSRRV